MKEKAHLVTSLTMCISLTLESVQKTSFDMSVRIGKEAVRKEDL